MFKVWDERVRPEGDLCCYWFEKARSQIQRKMCGRAGLLATQGIRGGANRDTLKRIQESGNIFFAVSDRDWILDGANVHVSMVGFDDGAEAERSLDGRPSSEIRANLTAGADVTQARRLRTNANLCFMGDTKGGAFDLSDASAQQMLLSPNPHGRPNSDVIVPWVNGLDMTRRARQMWIIDFGVDATIEVASRYEVPFGYVREHVKPARDTNNRESYRMKWWIHVEPRPALRDALGPLQRYLVTISVGKHRPFRWLEQPVLPDHQLFAFARDEEWFLGIVHSAPHELWARAQGTQVRERESGFRYTPTSCFETFPFPLASDPQKAVIAKAVVDLDRLRANWLDPLEWVREEILEFPGSVKGPWAHFVHHPDDRGIGTVRYPRLVPKDEECAKELKKRTLTNLYNQQPTWLNLAHQKLDEAVFAAYGWPSNLSDEQILEKLLALNLERAGKELVLATR